MNKPDIIALIWIVLAYLICVLAVYGYLLKVAVCNHTYRINVLRRTEVVLCLVLAPATLSIYIGCACACPITTGQSFGPWVNQELLARYATSRDALPDSGCGCR